MHVVIGQGEAVQVLIEGSDGEFHIEYGSQRLFVKTDLPDSLGRSGVIYDEVFDPLSLPDGVDTDLDTLSEAARAKALQEIPDDQILAMYNLFEAEAQRRGLMGV